jgi:hypothetical protein
MHEWNISSRDRKYTAFPLCTLRLPLMATAIVSALCHHDGDAQVPRLTCKRPIYKHAHPGARPRCFVARLAISNPPVPSVLVLVDDIRPSTTTAAPGALSFY